MSSGPLWKIAYSLDEAADAVSLSRTRLQEAINSGDLPVAYSGIKPIVRALDLDAWVAALPTERKTRTA